MSTSTEIDQLLEAFSDPHVTDLVVNGADETLVLTSGGWRAFPFRTTGDRLSELAVVLVSLANRHLDLASPLADVTLSSGELPTLARLGVAQLRVHAVLGGAVSGDTLLSLRAHRSGVFQNLEALLLQLCESPAQRDLVEQIATSGQSFLISGAPGTGKTTLLRAMLAKRPQLRTLVLEDTAELLPISGHFIGLQVRQANTESRGEVGLAQLLRESLRMMPERLVVGEVRGDEAAILVEAINLAGVGGAGTIHSRKAEQVGQRLSKLARREGALEVFDWHIHLQAAQSQRSIGAIQRCSNV